MSSSTDTTHARKSTRLAVPLGGADHPSVTSTSTTSTMTTPPTTPSATQTGLPAARKSTYTNNNSTMRGGLLSSSSSSSSQYHNYYYLQQRLWDVRQMDIQSALDQMRTLLSARPQLIYKTAYYRKQTKNHWARDDPAFFVLQFCFLAVSCFAYSIAFMADWPNGLSFWTASVLWNWLGLGCIIATATQTIANRHLQNTNHHHTARTSPHVQQQVEWLYAFDIHCNSFFPVFVVLCTFQYCC
jgi:UNC-50 family